MGIVVVALAAFDLDLEGFDLGLGHLTSEFAELVGVDWERIMKILAFCHQPVRCITDRRCIIAGQGKA